MRLLAADAGVIEILNAIIGRGMRCAAMPGTCAAGKLDLNGGRLVHSPNPLHLPKPQGGDRTKSCLPSHIRLLDHAVDYSCKIPETMVFVSVSTANISLSAFTTTRARLMGDCPFGVICAVPVQSELMV